MKIWSFFITFVFEEEEKKEQIKYSIESDTNLNWKKPNFYKIEKKAQKKKPKIVKTKH